MSANDPKRTCQAQAQAPSVQVLGPASPFLNAERRRGRCRGTISQPFEAADPILCERRVVPRLATLTIVTSGRAASSAPGVSPRASGLLWMAPGSYWTGGIAALILS